MFIQDDGPGEDGDDTYRAKKILEMMKDETNRDAYLISRFAIADPNGKLIAKDVVKNKFKISTELRGTYGFGYDQILEITDYNLDNKNKDQLRKISAEILSFENKHVPTVAELNPVSKNYFNQRGYFIAKNIKKQIDQNK